MLVKFSIFCQLMLVSLTGLAQVDGSGFELESESESEQNLDVDPESIIDELNSAADDNELQDDDHSFDDDLGHEDDDSAQEHDHESAVEDRDDAVSEPEDSQTSDGVDSKLEPSLAVTSSLPKKRIFGDYKIHIGVSKPKFDKSDEYELVYGNSRFYPTFAVEYFFFDWYATLGWNFRVGYYKDDGYAVIQDGNGYTRDRQGKTDLTLIPLQTGISAQLTPFSAKWISIGGWFSAEATYFQEVRKDSGSSDEGSSPSSSDSSTSNNNKLLMTGGWRYGTNMGASMSFLLNGLDEKSVSSLRPLGLGAVYFTPYVEVTAGMFNDSDLEFDRMAMGAAFTFETL